MKDVQSDLKSFAVCLEECHFDVEMEPEKNLLLKVERVYFNLKKVPFYCWIPLITSLVLVLLSLNSSQFRIFSLVFLRQIFKLYAVLDVALSDVR